MDDESADILGQQTKPVLQVPRDDLRSGISMKAKLAYGFVALLFLYIVAMRVWIRIVAWRELSRKLAMRRKHGIPDSDRRPFNVAYAAVIRARQDMEAAERAKAKAAQALPHIDRRNALPDQNVRQRVGEQVASEVPRASTISTRLPGAYISPDGTLARGSSYYPGLSMSPALPSKPARLYPLAQYTPARLSSTGLQQNAKVRRLSQDLEGSGANNHNREEHPIEVKGRRERNEVRKSSGQGRRKHKRGTKRYSDDETEQEEDYIDQPPRDKRQRKVSLDHAIRASEEDDAMILDEGDDEAEGDEVAELPALGRGKKRDRAEAGSTFGGDEEGNASDVDLEDLDKPKRRRKRPTIKRKSDTTAAIRGQKRDRDSDEETTFVDETYISRKKRGKKYFQNDTDDEASENSIPDSRSSISGRKIGEEWTSNGIRWKIGHNGERLRQTLIRKARQKFPMPEDSQHPDRDANFEVFVEKWLTEDEYQDAKARHVLAWQDTPKKSVDSVNLAVDVKMQSPSKAVGKLLLWSSASTPVVSPNTGSLSTDSKYPGNPFNEPSISLPKRISSSRSTSFNNRVYAGLADSTNSSLRTRLFKVYSKFEKQEMEAEALTKLREIKNKKEAQSAKAQDTPAKETKELVVARNEKENADKAQPTSIFTSSSLPPYISTPQPTSQSTVQVLFGKPSTDQGKSLDSTNLPGSSTTIATAVPTNTLTPASSTPVNAPDTKDKSKDAAPPAVPMFSFPTPGSAPSSTAAANPGNMFSQPARSLTPASAPASGTASVEAAKVGQTSKPATTFSFAPSGSTATADSSQSASTKPLFSFGTSAAKQSNEQKTSETGSTTRPVQSLGATSSNSLLARLGPAANNSSTPPTASQTTPTFSFGAPPATSPFTSAPSQPATSQSSPSVASASAPTSTPKFSFGFSNPTPSTTATAPSKQTNSTFPTYTPLNSSMGSTESPKPSAASTTASQSMFSFKSPAASNMSNVASPTPNPSTSGVTPSASNGPVFSFGVPSSRSTETKTTDSSVAASNIAQPTTHSFNNGFAAPASANGANFSSNSTSFGAFGSQPSSATNTSPSLFNFNKATKDSPSIFGAGGSSNQPPGLKSFSDNSTTTTTSSGAANAFGSTGGSSLQPSSNNVFGSTSSLSNVFGGANKSTNAFGTSTPTNGAQPGTTSVFGSTANKAPEAPKPTFSFGNPESSKPSSQMKPADTSKPLFSFGASGPSNPSSISTSNAGSPNFSFNFGASNKGATAPATSQTSPFGTAGSETKPSVFGSQSSLSPFGNAGSGATNGSIFTGFGSSNTSQ